MIAAGPARHRQRAAAEPSRSPATPTSPTPSGCRPTLREAADLLEGSQIAREAFGDDVVDHYANAARVEVAAFDAAVTDWERVPQLRAHVGTTDTSDTHVRRHQPGRPSRSSRPSSCYDAEATDAAIARGRNGLSGLAARSPRRPGPAAAAVRRGRRRRPRAPRAARGHATPATPSATRGGRRATSATSSPTTPAAPERLIGQQIPVADGLDVTFHEPLGVVGVIVPWNFPMPIASWGFAPGARRRATPSCSSPPSSRR